MPAQHSQGNEWLMALNIFPNSVSFLIILKIIIILFYSLLLSTWYNFLKENFCGWL